MVPSVAYSHPGRTASDGCHYCRTNCASWGYTTGTRHCNGGSASSYQTSNSEPEIEAMPPKTTNTFYGLFADKIITNNNTEVQVIEITDGDTIKVKYETAEEKVRIIGIDTPETVDPRKPVECCGKEATEKLTRLIDGRTVKLVIDPNGDDRGTYGRLIRYVYLDSQDIGAEMIKQGYAYAYLKYPFTQSKMDEYKNYEKQARENEVGLWAPGVCGNDLTNSDNQESTPTTTNNNDIKLPELPKLPSTAQQPATNNQNDEDDFAAGMIWGIILTALTVWGYKKLKKKK